MWDSPLRLVWLFFFFSTLIARGQMIPHERILDENNFFLASAWELVPDKDARLGDANRDLIVIALSDLKLAAQENGTPDAMSSGELRFIPRGSHFLVRSEAGVTPQMIVVGLRSHWDAEIRPCVDPKKCSHAITAGGSDVGESALLFTNGFITAYKHYLRRGGTLANSYFSSTAKDHLLVIALRDLQANFDGQEEHLRAGQVYSSDANQVEVTAENDEARWVIIRMNVPKKLN
jgi:hypothetical protein